MSNKIEAIQNTCLRVILGVMYVDYISALEMCGLKSLYSRREHRSLRLHQVNQIRICYHQTPPKTHIWSEIRTFPSKHVPLKKYRSLLCQSCRENWIYTWINWRRSTEQRRHAVSQSWYQYYRSSLSWPMLNSNVFFCAWD